MAISSTFNEKIGDWLLGYYLGLVVPQIVGAALMAVVAVIAAFLALPTSLAIGIVSFIAGLLCFALFLMIGSWLDVKRKKRVLTPEEKLAGLTAIQRGMIIQIGEPSSQAALYQDVLEALELPLSSGRTHIERVRLEWMGLVGYDAGTTWLTDDGRRVWELILEEGED